MWTNGKHKDPPILETQSIEISVSWSQKSSRYHSLHLPLYGTNQELEWMPRISYDLVYDPEEAALREGKQIPGIHLAYGGRLLNLKIFNH